jgi:glutathione S-transferase
MEQMRPAKEHSENWMKRERTVIYTTLERMALELGETPWCMGTPFTFADIAVGYALGYLDFRFPDTSTGAAATRISASCTTS